MGRTADRLRRRPLQPSTIKHVGLARAISKLGYCSRSRAVALIHDGKVRLNGVVVRNPEAPVRLDKDQIEVEGKAVTSAERIYLVVNKPRGLVTTASDEKGRDTVYSLLPEEVRWVAPVGRLDQASEGLLLLTNDSEWAARITDPDSHLNKTYHVQIGSVADAQMLSRLELGVERPEGETLKAKTARLLRAGHKNSWIEVVLDEGKNRHIRRMLNALGIETLRLVRVSIGPLRLSTLAKGTYRPLRSEEKLQIDRALDRRST
jgi:23S rRNA pseudouridine2605 synthase